MDDTEKHAPESREPQLDRRKFLIASAVTVPAVALLVSAGSKPAYAVDGYGTEPPQPPA